MGDISTCHRLRRIILQLENILTYAKKRKPLFNGHLGVFVHKWYIRGVHIDLLTPILSTKERLRPWLNVQKALWGPSTP